MGRAPGRRPPAPHPRRGWGRRSTAATQASSELGDGSTSPGRSLSGGGGPARRPRCWSPCSRRRARTRVVLTVRSDRLRSHQGEVAFPGGRLEAGEGVVDGALREAYEEVGLDPGLGDGGRPAHRHAHRRLQHGDDPGGGHPGRRARRWSPTRPRWPGSSTWPSPSWWPTASSTRSGGRCPAGPGAARDPRRASSRCGSSRWPAETVWGATARTLIELLCLVLGVEFPPALAPGCRPPDRGSRPDPSGPGGPAGRPGGIVEAVGRHVCRSCHRSEVSTTATRVRRTYTWLS